MVWRGRCWRGQGGGDQQARFTGRTAGGLQFHSITFKYNSPVNIDIQLRNARISRMKLNNGSDLEHTKLCILFINGMPKVLIDPTSAEIHITS